MCKYASVIVSALSRDDDDDDAFARPRAAVKDAMNATFFFTFRVCFSTTLGRIDSRLSIGLTPRRFQIVVVVVSLTLFFLIYIIRDDVIMQAREEHTPSCRVKSKKGKK
jgi:choline-glycine betaine transporter